MISIIIPAFNRDKTVARAVNSAYAFINALNNVECEIIIVDDGSEDNTVEIVKGLIDKNNATNTVCRIISHEINKGVCSAKNTGAFNASNEWLIFLDSDDELLANAAQELIDIIVHNSETSLHFFRCVDSENQLIAKELYGSVSISLDEFLLSGTRGESLPVIRRQHFLNNSYEEDINGFEGLSYAKIIMENGAAKLHNVVARVYYTDGDDRLSTAAGVKRRAKSLSVGYFRLISRYHKHIKFKTLLALLVKYLYHKVRSLS